jgi:integrase/recombinase XerD
VEDVHAYLVHLTSKGYAWSSLNQTVCALRFFYGVTLGQTVILEQDSVRPGAAQTSHRAERRRSGQVSGSRSSLEARVALTTAYAVGLRVSEVAALSNNDSRRMVVRIERGKGARNATPCCP